MDRWLDNWEDVDKETKRWVVNVRIWKDGTPWEAGRPALDPGVCTFYTFYQPFPQYHQAALQLLGSGENRQGQNSVVMEIYIYHVTPLCGWNQTTLWLEPSVTPSRSLDPRVRSWMGALPCKIRLTVSLTQSHLQTGKNGMSYYYHSDMTHP